jgi:hypothetical protein
MDEKSIPISNAWLCQLMANGAVDPFKGPLKEFSQILQRPFWCRQMENVLDHNMWKTLNEVVPVVRQFKIGTSPYSEKKQFSGTTPGHGTPFHVLVNTAMLEWPVRGIVLVRLVLRIRHSALRTESLNNTTF